VIIDNSQYFNLEITHWMPLPATVKQLKYLAFYRVITEPLAFAGGFFIGVNMATIHPGIISITLNGGTGCVITSFRSSHSASFTSGEIR
jgi:hypothetical protein